MKNIIKKSITTILIFAMALTLAMPMQAEAKAKVKLNKTKVTLNVKKTYKLKVSGTAKKVTWSSSKKSVATVSKTGKVTAKKKGTATITAKVSGKKYTCKVTVKQPVTSVTLNKKTATLTKKGATVTLKATAKPSNANSKKVTWKSSNKKVATVKNGKVTAIANGTATITATATDGSKKKASCKVTVKIGSDTTTCQHNWVKHYAEKEIATGVTCACGQIFATAEEWQTHSDNAWMNDLPGHGGYSGNGYTTEKYVDYEYCSKCGEKRSCQHNWVKQESTKTVTACVCGMTFANDNEWSAHNFEMAMKGETNGHSCSTAEITTVKYVCSICHAEKE
ncbi:Ig-like domain-containing protein [Lachnospiraceae bacterium 46-15]